MWNLGRGEMPQLIRNRVEKWLDSWRTREKLVKGYKRPALR